MDSPSPNPPGIVISEEVQHTIRLFRQVVGHEKELASDPIMMGHMGDFVMKQVLMFLLEGRTDEEIVRYITNAQQSFRKHRSNPHPSDNPIKVYRRDKNQL